MSDPDHAAVVAASMRIMDALDGTDAVYALMALQRVLTGLLAGLSPTRDEAQRGCAAISEDMRKALDRRWADVELLRSRPAGQA